MTHENNHTHVYCDAYAYDVPFMGQIQPGIMLPIPTPAPRPPGYETAEEKRARIQRELVAARIATRKAIHGRA